MSSGRSNNVTNNKVGRRGELNLNARLTEGQVRTIRERYEHTPDSIHRIAIDYDVSAETVRLIVRGLRWTHI